MAEKTFPFINRGVVLKLEPGSLQPGQLMISKNIDSFQEGAIAPRGGSKRFIGDLPSGTNWLLPHSLAKMTTGRGDALDPRYVGEQSNIWRVTGPYSHDELVTTGLGLIANPNARWEAQPYNSGTSGRPFIFFAHPVRMLKDDGTFMPLRRWGIPPPVITPGLSLGGSAVPGPDASQGLPYTYLYTFRNPQTGAEGNPNALPIDSATISPVNQSVVIQFWGADTDAVTGDPALQGLGSIAIYRSGGSFADNFYRLVGYDENPGYAGGVPLSGTFIDSAPDINLINARTIEFDNDMPVTSSLLVPFVGQIQNIVTIGSFKRLFLNNYPNFGFGISIAWNTANPEGFFTPGSLVTIGTAANQETAIIFRVDPTNGVTPHWIDVALQSAHFVGEQVTGDAIAGKPCDLICLYGDALLLAGDPSNPHIVYRSKAGRPDAFPVVDLEDGNSHQLNVGSPSNPVMGIMVFNGEVVCINRTSIFVFIVLNGTMSPPQQTPSDRGMIAKNCWTKVGNEIWFLSYDGIYSWSGGGAQLRSEALHSIFNGTTTVLQNQTYYPISYDPVRLAAFYMASIDQEVWLHYIDVNGSTVLWRYQLLYDRWLPADFHDGIGAMLSEKDTGRLIVGIQDNSGGAPASYLQQVLIGTTDNWTVSEDGGDKIGWSLQTGYISPEERTRTVQFTELVLEVLNPDFGPGDTINVNLSYDYLTNPDGSALLDSVDAFQISDPNSKRTFLYFPLQRSSVDGTALGKEAKCVCLVLAGSTSDALQIFSWTLRYNVLQEPTRNSILDWQSLGSPNDKQLYCLAMEFDPQGQQVSLLLDMIAGVPGTQVAAQQVIVLQPAVWTSLQVPMGAFDTTMTFRDQTNVVPGAIIQVEQEIVFVLSIVGPVATVTRGYLGTIPTSHVAAPDHQVYTIGRVKQMFPIVDNTICKAVRLRPAIPDIPFDIFSWEFTPIEQYPPDIVYFSQLTDNGSPYLKFFNQVAMDVDTGGVTVDVGLELDGAIVFTFPVNTNRFTRYKQFTCPGKLAGVNARIVPRLPLAAGAKFQLWYANYVTTPADKGPVTHTTDWDDLGTQFDKQLQTITFEYDGSAGDVDFQVEELTGVRGDQPSAGIAFHVSGASRGKQTFPFPDGHIAKMVRVSPVSAVPLGFRAWTYSIKKIDFPPDFILFTDISNNGSPYLKFFNQIVLEVDTGGQPVIVLLELDGIVKWEFTVTSTRLTRRQAFVCPQQLSGIDVRLLIKYPSCLGITV